MSALLAALYGICLFGLAGFALFVIAQNPRAALNRCFAWLAFALLGWVASLFAFDFNLASQETLWIGRLNFACIILATTLGFLFVQEVGKVTPAELPLMQRLQRQKNALSLTLSNLPLWLWVETAVLTVLSFTPLIDAQERIVHGQHETQYGPLFALYMAHVFALLGASLYRAFQPAASAPRETRTQLWLIGSGIVVMAVIALITNVFLPYALMDFRFIYVGTLSTIFFLVAVGYAVFAHHLFSVHRIVRAAFVYAGLITLALELYQLAVTFLAHLLPVGDAASRSYAATALALVVNAFTQQSVRRWLNRLVDRLLGQSRFDKPEIFEKPETFEKRGTKEEFGEGSQSKGRLRGKGEEVERGGIAAWHQ